MRTIVFSLLIFLCSSTFAQIKGWIFLKDKAGSTFHPEAYFTSKGLQKYHPNLNDSTDFPVNERYISELRDAGMMVHFESRWLNAVLAEGSEKAWKNIREFSFIHSIDRDLFLYQEIISSASERVSKEDLLLAQCQLERMNGDIFRQNNLTGKGLLICVADVGFTDVDVHPAFQHLFKNNQIKGIKDFAGGKKDVYYGNNHGTAVLSNIAGRKGDQWLGLAQDADFLLAKTENRKERFEEEKNWLAMLEWAHQQGADIISSSLGYTSQRYEPWMMDGKTTFISKTATLAARKGILVITAAGNEAESKWHYIAAPGDADSVLTVGGIDPKTGIHSSFSSYGPTADGRMKPNVCAYGTTLTAKPGGRFIPSDGTSFATPLVAGFAACLWQKHPEWTNMEVYHAIENASDLNPYFDYHHGFGVPQADRALFGYESPKQSTFHVDTTGNYWELLLDTVLKSYVNAYVKIQPKEVGITGEDVDNPSTNVIAKKMEGAADAAATEAVILANNDSSMVKQANSFLVLDSMTNEAITDSATFVEKSSEELTNIDVAIIDSVGYDNQLSILGMFNQNFDSKKLLDLLPKQYYIRWPKMVFYSIENEKGQLIEYKTFIPVSKNPITWYNPRNKKNVLRVFYWNQTAQLKTKP